MAHVRLFAAAEDAVGTDTLTRDEPTLGALRDALTAEFPQLRGILPRCVVLVGGALHVVLVVGMRVVLHERGGVDVSH